MNHTKYRFNLDMQSHISQISLPMRQNDTGIVLRINLTDGGIPYTIKDGCMAWFFGRKTDGNTLIYPCSIENNTTICFEVTQQTTACLGIVDCEIRLYGSDENIITTPRFIVVVYARVMNDSEAVDSESDMDILDNILLSEADRLNNEMLREQNHAKMLETTERATAAAEELERKLATGDYDGITPHVGANGNWWFDEEDSGVLARGITPHIGANGNWWFNDIDSGVEADAGKHTHDPSDIADVIPISLGGTGANNAADALKNLGLQGVLTTRVVTATSSVTNEAIYNSNADHMFTYRSRTFEIALDIKPAFVTSCSNGSYEGLNLGSNWYKAPINFDSWSDSKYYEKTYRTGNTFIIDNERIYLNVAEVVSTGGTNSNYFYPAEHSYLVIGYEQPITNIEPPEEPDTGGEDEGGDTPDVPMISFTLTAYNDGLQTNHDSKTYTVSEGTTWGAWNDTVGHFYTDNTYILPIGSGGYAPLNAIHHSDEIPNCVTLTTPIIDGQSYEFYGAVDLPDVEDNSGDDSGSTDLVTFHLKIHYIAFDPTESTYTVASGTTWGEWCAEDNIRQTEAGYPMGDYWRSRDGYVYDACNSYYVYDSNGNQVLWTDEIVNDTYDAQ